MTFLREHIASSTAPVTGEHSTPSNNTDDSKSPNITVSSGVSYQAQSLSPPSPRSSAFHESSNGSITAQNLEMSTPEECKGSTDEKSEFVFKKPTTNVIFTRQGKIAYDFKGLGTGDRDDSQTNHPMHRQDTIVSNFNPEQAEQITSQSLSQAPYANIVYNFEKITELFHTQQYLAIELLLDDIDTTTFNECTLDHYDFITALTYYKLESFTKAKLHLEEIIHRIQGDAISSLSVKIGSLMEANYYLASIFYDIQDFDNAAKHYQSAIDGYPTSRPLFCDTFRIKPISAVFIFRGLSLCQQAKHNIQDAIEYYKLGVIAATNSDEKISSLISLADFSKSLGLHLKAAAYYMICIKIATQTNDNLRLECCYSNIGLIYLDLRQYKQALESFYKALELSFNNLKNLSMAYNNLGLAYQKNDNTDKASEYYDLALGQAIFSENVKDQVRAYGNIGNVYFIKHEYKRAQLHYQEMIRLTKDDKTKFIAKNNLAYAQYGEATNQIKKLSDNQKDVTFKQYSDFVINSDPLFHILKNSPEITKVDDAKKLLLFAIRHLGQTIEYELSHIPNTIDRYKRNLLKSIPNQCVNLFRRHQDCLLVLGEYEQALVVAVYARDSCILTECQASTVNSSDHFDTVTFPLNHSQIVKAITASNRPTSILSFTGERLSIWYCHQTQKQNANPMTLYVFPSNEDYLNESMIKFLIIILHSPNGITRLIDQSFTISDRELMIGLSIAIEQINTLIEKLEPFISHINSVLPSEEEKESILWLT